MKKFLIKHGIVKTEQQANYVLIAFIILCFAFIFFKLSNTMPNRNVETVDEYDEFTDDGTFEGEVTTDLDAELQS